MADPQTLLPDGYSIVRRAVPAGNLTVDMYLVEDPNQLAMEVAADDFSADERLPYWAELWPSAHALAGFLVQGGRLDDVDVVELGCGTGLAGVVAAMLGGDVLFTDFEADALRFAAANHALNLAVPGVTRLVDWRDPPADLEAALVLGADVLYERRFIEPLIATLQAVVAPGGTALIAEPNRQVATDAVDQLERTGFCHVLHLGEVALGDSVYPVWIHELQAPDPKPTK